MNTNDDNYLNKILKEQNIINDFLAEEIRFISEAEQYEFELFYFKDVVDELEFMYMIDYLLSMKNLIMMIRFVYKHSNYIIQKCISKKDSEYDIDDEKKGKVINRIKELYDL